VNDMSLGLGDLHLGSRARIESCKKRQNYSVNAHVMSAHGMLPKLGICGKAFVLVMLMCVWLLFYDSLLLTPVSYGFILCFH